MYIYRLGDHQATDRYRLIIHISYTSAKQFTKRLASSVMQA